ncbi:MAG: Ni/Fe hydrogenase subunit alpha [Zetaproteobacteria bacterium CG12_big_fil_rev_8_21_14_0_65_54_13]|nr:MAG: Ni/Fe hydrogenase subunit alpha [Zetaproteobacteria bacterium CG23_combo_of_CG06-09_8_20_14_all_54_7]PIW49469.1 MAG: Ni/Fe hydrogenase subunit alpha [Zetaproteobacteria bacterium CG12_big_fil_rev_8_21_14_0_65_54_13]PIX54327.1 MAG: Ni/Fe hydrogenase subunit alpha [Zetaproteobacteria bacterium CG_4_10_14_3_um_filter_54_28]PJA28531.1 MAG: Ni/Fe hydrogenase subunit alpha [Zetaproteobacteria bacterium CG_4_9_14_3_um_filter_54_145]
MSEQMRRIAIDPVTRVEGHGKITLLMDAENRVHEARLHIVEFRGFEKFIQGRPFDEVPTFVQRLCGICPVSHHLAAAKAVDQLVGVDELTPTSLKLRQLLHFGQTLQSHALHFFHLSSPDLLFGFGSDVAMRNIVGVIDKHPEIAIKGVKMRKYGQQVIAAISGKRVHGSAAVPGGMNKSLSVEERNVLLADIADIKSWAQDAVTLNEQIHMTHAENHGFATLNTHFLSMVGGGGELELYHGGLRARKPNGDTIFDHFDYRGYQDIIREEVRPWSYMKFPYLTSLGKDEGWYRVGPLARVNNCDFISTPMAEAARQRFRAFADGGFVHDTLAYHWARMIEALHCAESIELLLNDQDISGDDLVVTGEKQSEGIGVIEAPRGTLFHHYKIDEEGLIEKANLIVSTTSNNQAMNESVRSVANEYIDGNEITEGLLNHLEVAVRAYDPCLSCATHAMGKMPLQVELIDANGTLVDRVTKGSNGSIERSL